MGGKNLHFLNRKCSKFNLDFLRTLFYESLSYFHTNIGTFITKKLTIIYTVNGGRSRYPTNMCKIFGLKIEHNCYQSNSLIIIIISLYYWYAKLQYFSLFLHQFIFISECNTEFYMCFTQEDH